jgi:serine phosphatase RsbU (regulator of sigma subunit)
LILNSNDGTLEKNKKYTFGEVRRIVEENEHTICGGTAYNGVFRIKNISSEHEQINTMDTSNGLPSLGYNLPFKVNGSFLFGTQKGIYEYDKAFNKFIPTSDFAKNYFDSNDQIYQIIEGFNDNIWLFKTNSKLHEFFLYNVKIKKATFPLRRMGEYDAYLCIFPENENVTWFGGPDGLFRYDASMPSFDTLSYHTKIRAVYCNNDTLFGGYWGFDENGKKIYTQPAIAVPEMVYKNNNINFEFAALSFDNEKENLYSYYLEGFDGGWSDWTSESKKSYTNLNEGTYTFHVKSKNVYGKVGEEDTYTFTILPPWYRTSSAYLIYAIGAVMMVYVITQLSTRRLKRAKEKLEAIVISRTAEVVAEKEEVEKQKKIVEVKNKDITDSINYAQKIQQAILPLHDEFSKVFPQSFIYFQPRDIVSGDFYWFYPPHKMDQNCVYLAAADCTGHGVPGAFMSMIGNTLLNEILNEKQIYECDAILNQLHTEVRSALKQDIAQNTTNDGMDIALCRVHLDTLELQYAGANRALYIFRPKTSGYEFIEIKPNKFPIGGFQAETTRQFTAHTLQLKQGDTLYMFSDGYADQFGGANNKKFMVKRLQAELMGMQHLPLHDQKVLIAKLLNDWKGSTEQVDDILMIGVRV